MSCTRSPGGASSVTTTLSELAGMRIALDCVILDNISNVNAQFGAENDPAFIRSFLVHLKMFQSSLLDALNELIEIRRNDL